MMSRPAGRSVSITITLIPTPSPATTPKSWIAGMGESSPTMKLPMVVNAARARGTVTTRSPDRAATSTDALPVLASR